MSNRLKGFKFKIHTAFYFADNLGYDAILVEGLNATTINFLVDGIPYIINIEDETEFINDLLEIKVDDWNNNGYIFFTEDAWSWNIELVYDNGIIVSGGFGSFPKNFPVFMDLLHEKYGLKYSKLDSDKKIKGKVRKFEWWSEETEIIPYRDL